MDCKITVTSPNFGTHCDVKDCPLLAMVCIDVTGWEHSEPVYFCFFHADILGRTLLEFIPPSPLFRIPLDPSEETKTT